MMYGLSKDLDLSFLVGPTLIQVCIGAYVTILHFDPDISITIESKFRVVDPQGCDTTFDNAPSAAGALVTLLSNSITKVSGQPDGTLRLLFANDGLLEIYDSSKNFESYQIRHGPKEYIV